MEKKSKHDKSCIYITYDKNLKNFLLSNDLECLVFGVNPNSDSMFWVFERTNYLNSLLDKWFSK